MLGTLAVESEVPVPRTELMPERVYHLTDVTVWVAGHTGMVGSAVVRRPASEPTLDPAIARSSIVGLRRQHEEPVGAGAS